MSFVKRSPFPCGRANTPVRDASPLAFPAISEAWGLHGQDSLPSSHTYAHRTQMQISLAVTPHLTGNDPAVLTNHDSKTGVAFPAGET